MPTTKPLRIAVPADWSHVGAFFQDAGHGVEFYPPTGEYDLVLGPEHSYFEADFIKNDTLVQALIAKARKRKTWEPKAPKSKKASGATPKKSQASPLINLKARMEAAGHTTTTLSELAGVSDETIRKCFRANYKPNKPNAMALAAALEVTVEDLTGEKGGSQ